jgi:hypothetical protein
MPGIGIDLIWPGERTAVIFAGRVLARRLERGEGHACVQFARAHRRLFPDSGADWTACAGAYVVFDGVDSPVTQSARCTKPSWIVYL